MWHRSGVPNIIVNVANFPAVSVPLPCFRITQSKTTTTATNTKSQTKKRPFLVTALANEKENKRLTWKGKNVNKTTQHIGDRYHSFDVTRSRQKNNYRWAGGQGRVQGVEDRSGQNKTESLPPLTHPQATAVLRVAVWMCPQLATGSLHHCRSFKGKLLSSVTPKGCFVLRHSGCRYLPP